jgi:hypothetical protein
VSRRWYVTGGAGSGKSTLAAELSRRHRIPHHDVDTGSLPPDGADAWVVEGAHVWGMDRYVAEAEVVVWLDLPLRVTVPRIVRRHVRRTIRRDNPHPGTRKLLRFVLAQRRYATAPARAPEGPQDWGAITRANTAELLQRLRPAGDVVHLRTPAEVRGWRATG